MPAICRCENNHTFSACATYETPERREFTLDREACPDCGTEEFEIIEMVDEWEDD